MDKEIEEPKCVMCNKTAVYLAEKTKEPLCPKCAYIDNQLMKEKYGRNQNG